MPRYDFEVSVRGLDERKLDWVRTVMTAHFGRAADNEQVWTSNDLVDDKSRARRVQVDFYVRHSLDEDVDTPTLAQTLRNDIWKNAGRCYIYIGATNLDVHPTSAFTFTEEDYDHTAPFYKEWEASEQESTGEAYRKT